MASLQGLNMLMMASENDAAANGTVGRVGDVSRNVYRCENLLEQVVKARFL
jgi:hypothetical protein